MANVLTMAKIESILSLHAQGWSQRRIARELGVDRETVGKYLSQRSHQAKPATVSPQEFGPTGSDDTDGSKPATFSASPGPEAKPAGSIEAPIGSQTLGETSPSASIQSIEAVHSSSAPIDSRTTPSRSQCRPYEATITAKLAEGLSLTRIQQDLASEGIHIAYDSLRRFVRRIGHVRPLPFRRLECGPGEEAQVDFGTGAPIILPDGKRKKTNVFRIVLSHSRKGYSEATFTQSTEEFFRCLENAFAHFGGIP